ncbi:hypothetical protein GVAMD_0458 [Gardnerella vaginalis AMD]|nr:hypothetical protein GVAMD_0458 [Gardnerella vaginalis AMD]
MLQLRTPNHPSTISFVHDLLTFALLSHFACFAALAGIYKNRAAFLQLLLHIFAFNCVNINIVNKK